MSFLMILRALSVGEDFIYLYTQSPAVVDYYSCLSYISLLLLVIVLVDYCNYLSYNLLYTQSIVRVDHCSYLSYSHLSCHSRI